MIDRERLERIVSGFGGERIAVVGDVMLDRKYVGETRIKDENAGVLNLKVEEIVDMPGGAGNVAANVAALGGTAYLFGVIGEDEAGESLIQKLKKGGINFSYSVCGPTIVKARVYAQNGHHMFSLDFGEASGQRRIINSSTLRSLFYGLQSTLQKFGCDGVIASDYNKGIFVDNNFGRTILELMPDRYTSVDCKPANVPNFENWSLLKINEKEARVIAGKTECDNENDLAMRVKDAAGVKSVMITLGARGICALGEEFYRFPAFDHTRTEGGNRVFDVVGAGDTVNAVANLAGVCGATLEEAAYLANLAGSVVVEKPGTATLTREELVRRIREDLG